MVEEIKIAIDNSDRKRIDNLKTKYHFLSDEDIFQCVLYHLEDILSALDDNSDLELFQDREWLESQMTEE